MPPSPRSAAPATAIATASLLRRPLADIGNAAFWTLTALALPGCLLTTAAYYGSQPAFLAQLSPFRVQYAVLLAAHLLFCLALRRTHWAAFFTVFLVFNVWAVLRPGLPPRVTHTDATQTPLKVLLANVLTSNTDPVPLLALIAAEKPDLIALLEINTRWQGELAPALLAAYPHSFLKPREDNFGLGVFSREPLAGGQVEFFADIEMPSFVFDLPRGNLAVRVAITHPLPPGDADTTRLRDQHLGDLANWTSVVAGPDRATPPPTLILGDLNATPWCPPLRRLLATTGLHLASREHTVFAASWPVPIPFLRVPLDHALLNSALACTAYRIGPDIGSDHFPVILEVQPTQRTSDPSTNR